MVEAAKEVLGKPRRAEKPWINGNILRKCDKRRDLKKTKTKSEEKEKGYKDINKAIRDYMNKAKENWMGEKS